jgi:DNA-binding NtrC family response regulator
MPARIVFVHDDPTFRERVVSALGTTGISFAYYPDALEAAAAMELGRSVRLIITRIQFAEGRSNGVSLVQQAKLRNRAVRVIFTEDGGFRKIASDHGLYMEMPVSLDELMTALRNELQEYDQDR